MEALAQNTYTMEKPLSERVIEILKELKMNKAELALRMNFSRSAVSQYLNGKYNSNPEALEEKLTEFVKEYEEHVKSETEEVKAIGRTVSGVKPKIAYFESKDYIQTIGVCKSCQENMALGIIVAKCDDTMACRDLVEAIEIQIGMPKGSGGTIWSRVKLIRDFFNANEGYLLIIDEADKLINKYTQKKMEIIRGIFDQSDVGIVIAGEPRLEAEIKGNLARFANRMDFYYKLKGLSPQEVKDYMEGYDVDDAAMMEFISRATNAQTGCFRLLDRTLNNVIRILKENGQTQITMKIVNQASNMMML